MNWFLHCVFYVVLFIFLKLSAEVLSLFKLGKVKLGKTGVS